MGWNFLILGTKCAQMTPSKNQHFYPRGISVFRVFVVTPRWWKFLKISTWVWGDWRFRSMQGCFLVDFLRSIFSSCIVEKDQAYINVHGDFLCSYFERLHSLRCLRLCTKIRGLKILLFAKFFWKSRDLSKTRGLLPDPHDHNSTDRSYDRAILDQITLES